MKALVSLVFFIGLIELPLSGYVSPMDLIIQNDISPAAAVRGGSTAFSSAALTFSVPEKYSGTDKNNNSMELTLSFFPGTVSMQQLGWLTMIEKQPWHMRLSHLSTDFPVASGSGEGTGDVNLRVLQASIATGFRLGKTSPLAVGVAFNFLGARTYVYDHNYLFADISTIFAVNPAFPKFSLTIRNIGFDFNDVAKILNPNTNVIIGSQLAPLYSSPLPLTAILGLGFNVWILALEVALKWSPYPLPEKNETWGYGEFNGSVGLGATLLKTKTGTGLTLNLGGRTRGSATLAFSGGLVFDIKIGELLMRWLYSIEPTPGFEPTQNAGLILNLP